MKNKDKLTKITRSNVRAAIIKFGIWNGIVLYKGESRQDKYYHPDDCKDKLVYATLTNIANLSDINLLEFYNLS